jgi:hypothetical protein
VRSLGHQLSVDVLGGQVEAEVRHRLMGGGPLCGEAAGQVRKVTPRRQAGPAGLWPPSGAAPSSAPLTAVPPPPPAAQPPQAAAPGAPRPMDLIQVGVGLAGSKEKRILCVSPMTSATAARLVYNSTTRVTRLGRVTRQWSNCVFLLNFNINHENLTTETLKFPCRIRLCREILSFPLLSHFFYHHLRCCNPLQLFSEIIIPFDAMLRNVMPHFISWISFKTNLI